MAMYRVRLLYMESGGYASCTATCGPLPQSDALIVQHLYKSMKEQKVKGIVQVTEVVV